jgi:hypothetical protein
MDIAKLGFNVHDLRTAWRTKDKAKKDFEVLEQGRRSRVCEAKVKK